MKQDYRTRVYYSEPVERVWRALTDPAELARWLLRADFRPSRGHRFKWKDATEGGALPCPLEDASCEVREAAAPHKLELLARPAPKPGKDEAAGVFRVTWTLEVAGEGTWLTLEQEFLPEASVSILASLRMSAAAGASGWGDPRRRRRHPSFIRIRPSGERQAA